MSVSNLIYHLIRERNASEITPFISVLESNATLLNQVDSLQNACELAKREIATLRRELQEVRASSTSGTVGGTFRFVSNNAAQAALKNETRLREKIELLHEELSNQLSLSEDQKANSAKLLSEKTKLKELNTDLHTTITHLRSEVEQLSLSLGKMSEQNKEVLLNTRLAEQQYDGLKVNIRVLQHENEALRQENIQMKTRLIADKSNPIKETNVLNDMIDDIKKNAAVFTTSKVSAVDHIIISHNESVLCKNGIDEQRRLPQINQRIIREEGNYIPSSPKIVIAAHSADGTSLSMDHTGRNLVVTGSVDSTVKVWDTSSGSLRSSFRGSHGHSITECDVSGNTVVGAGSDKTCRVWNMSTNRMIHRLVGHQHKITCVRIFGKESTVITGSADYFLKVWDISRNTYRLVSAFHHTSVCTCVDVGMEDACAVSGHMDGSLRFWDIRSGEKTLDIPELHNSGVCSVMFHNSNSNLLLTKGLDSTIFIVDVRKTNPIQSLQYPDNISLHLPSRSVFSPDCRYVASGSSTTGQLQIWDATSGILLKSLKGHEHPIVALDWSLSGKGMHPITTLDRKGTMMLWS